MIFYACFAVFIRYYSFPTHLAMTTATWGCIAQDGLQGRVGFMKRFPPPYSVKLSVTFEKQNRFHFKKKQSIA